MLAEVHFKYQKVVIGGILRKISLSCDSKQAASKHYRLLSVQALQSEEVGHWTERHSLPNYP